MNARTRLMIAIASLFSTMLTLGSVLALADHYGGLAQSLPAGPEVVAKR